MTVTPEQREFAEGLKLVVIAVVCAAVSATLVIGVGQVLLRPQVDPVLASPGGADPDPASG